MKQAISILLLLTLLTGCGSPSKTAYKTLKAVGIAEDKAMVVAAKARHEGLLTQAQWNDVLKAHGRFQAGFNAACDIAGFDKSAPPPSQVITLLADLVTLLNNFGVQLNL